MTVPPEETARVGRTPPFPQVQDVQPMACPTCGLLPVLQYQTWGRFGRESIVEADEQFVADCKARNAAIREWNERVSAAPPSGEAPKLIEALRACEEVLRLIHDAAGPVPKSAPMPTHSTFEAWKLAHDALNAAPARQALAAEQRDHAGSTPAAAPAPRLSGEQVKAVERLVANALRDSWGDRGKEHYQRLADALNALLGSAPQKEQVDSVTSPKDGPP